MYFIIFEFMNKRDISISFAASRFNKRFYGNHCAEPVSLCKVKVVSSNAKTTLRLTEK